MSARGEYLADVLCHCDQTAELPEVGHPLGTPGCSTEVKPGRYSDEWCSSDHYGMKNCTKCHGSASGTCPECGKQARVVRVQTRGLSDGGIDTGLRAGPLLQVLPGMAPHKVGGRECAGAGRVPVETTCTGGRALAEWLAAGAA